MDVDQAAQVPFRDERGNLPAQGGLDLAAALAQLRLDVREAEGGIDLRLARGGQARAPLRPEEAPLGELEAESLRAFLDLPDMLLRAGEDEQSRRAGRP